MDAIVVCCEYDSFGRQCNGLGYWVLLPDRAYSPSETGSENRQMDSAQINGNYVGHQYYQELYDVVVRSWR
ncbi:hypothetical protein D3C86_1917690 [compost metagenome]